MTQAYVVIGDRTDHGGIVVGGSAMTTIMGKPIARVGDLTVCPKCKGSFPITSGDETWTIDGQAAARHGDKTACGATLIAASQALTFYDGGCAAAASEKSAAAAAKQAEAAAATSTVAAEAPDICLDCLKAATAAGSTAVVRG